MNAFSEKLRTQVIIIGAGPTGLSMAAQLIRYNIDFIILDKSETTTLLSKALVVQARTMEIFKELNLSEKAIAAGQPTKTLSLMRHGKVRASIDIGNLGKGLSDFPYALSLEQSKTEKLLYDFLKENNRDVMWQSEFIQLQQNENSVTVQFRDKEGNLKQAEADYLAGCDGAKSPVRHQLGLSFEGDTEPKTFYVADVFLKSSVINKKEFYFFLTKKGFILFFSMEGEEHYRIVGVLPPSKDTEQHFEFKDIEASIIEEVECDLVFTELKWFSSYRIHSRKAGIFQNERCFICGDAGHIHTPAGGQGMNTGIQDAYNLAWKMAFTLNKKTNEEVLKTYSAERTENAAHLLKTTDKLFDAMAGTNVFWDFFRQHIFPFIAKEVSQSALGKRKVFPLISQTGIAYPHSYLTLESNINEVKAGDRMPYFIDVSGRSVFDFLTAPVFKIICFGKEQIETKTSVKHNIPFETYCFKQIFSKIFDNEKEVYILLRPDNHISYIGREIKPCYDFLEKIAAE